MLASEIAANPSRGDGGGYALGETILAQSGSPDFFDCKVKNYKLKMGYDAAFNCFTNLAFSSDVCETRRNAIKTVSASNFGRTSNLNCRS